MLSELPIQGGFNQSTAAAVTRQRDNFGGNMKKNTTAGALLIAGVLALTACGGSAEGTDDPSTAAASSPSATATPTAEAEQYSAGDLEAALTAVKTEQGLSGQVVNDATLRPQLEAAAEAIAQIVITPEECGDLATSNLAEKVDSANVAVMQLSETDALTILSYEDVSFIEDQLESNASQAEKCTEFQMEAGGEVSTASAKPIDASTDAETTEAYTSVVTTAGQTVESYQVSGFSGTLNISVSITNPSDPEGAIAAAEELINAVLAELEAK